jgi:hypothetical protein
MRLRGDCDDEAGIATFDGVLTADECVRVIARVRGGRWLPSAQLNDDRPLVTSAADPDGADQDAVARVDDPVFALRLYQRVATHLPASWQARELQGLLPRMHCLRYLAGDRSALHRDHAWDGGGEARSELTLLVYLNADFQGGQTEFPEQRVCVVPAAGRAVLFPHGLLHRGAPVEAGTKYLLRTEIYYAPERGRLGAAPGGVTGPSRG